MVSQSWFGTRGMGPVSRPGPALTPRILANVMASVVLTLLTLTAGAAGWGGLAWLVLNVPPNRPLAVTAAYCFAFCGIASTAALITWLVFRGRARDARF